MSSSGSRDATHETMVGGVPKEETQERFFYRYCEELKEITLSRGSNSCEINLWYKSFFRYLE